MTIDIRRRAALVAGLGLIALNLATSGVARADDPPTSLLATIPAVPDGAATTAVVRSASAEVFRPAPVPNDGLANPDAPVPGQADEASLHPEILGVHESGSGALATASSEYDHTARFHPGGGMGLTIPMQ